MNILELAILKKMVGGGGGSGTDNYNDLSNLPQINGETLAGNKTAENLGLQDALTFDSAPTEDSTNPVESGGVYNALAGKQDNLTFDDDPTENSTNPVKSGGVYSALAGKQDNLTFDGVYNASTNKAATESTVTNAIAGLDVSAFSVDADETISSISETDGKINVTKQDIAIASNQVTAMTGYTKPSSAPATPAIQTSDTANQAFGKLEFKADTNQTNILYALQTGVKNLLDFANLKFKNQGSTVFTKTDTYITTTSTNSWASTTYGMELPAGTYVFSANISDLSIGSGGAAKIVLDSNAGGQGTRAATIAITQNGAVNGEFTWGGGTLYIMYYPNYSSNVVTTTFTASNNMICTKTAWDQEPNVYRPFALPNYDLTRLESEDRAGLVECVDGGAKNKLQNKATSKTENNVTFTVNSDGEVTVSTTAQGASANTSVSLTGAYIPNTFVGNILSGVPSGSTGDKCLLIAYSNNGSSEVKAYYINAATYPMHEIQNYPYFQLFVWFKSGQVQTTPLKYQPMICTKAAFGVSNKFVPYRPNYDLVCNNAIGYSLDSTTQSNAELLQRACEFYGVDKTKAHAGIISVCTNTTQEYAFYYFLYQYNGVNYKAEISKMNIEITAINAWGTVALTGGTAPYHIGVLFFNK